MKKNGYVNKKSIKLISLGCSKNLVDSEKILAQLPSERFYIVHEPQQAADIVIINTCGFIHDAREESIDTILEVLQARKHGLAGEVIVTGCLTERYKDVLQQEIPEVNAWFGARDPEDLFSYLKEKFVLNDPRRFLTTPSHYAYLKIAEGCDRTCSFCAIPAIRGHYRSLPVDLLTEEAVLLAAKGVKELILVAQDLSYYGFDKGGKSLLAPLLQRLCQVDGIEWIRLHYAYPHQFPDDVIQLVATEPKICNYLDIPVQHINDNILRSMRRGHDKKGTIRLLEKLRREIPGLALRTTLMVGYPGETDKEFKELAGFVEAMRFDRLGVFAYSMEDHTRAYALGDPVKESVKQKRLETIMSLQSGISSQKNHSMIGRKMTVLIDSEAASCFVGRTEYDSPEVDNEVIVEKTERIEPGMFVQAGITGAADYELYARAWSG